MTKSTKRSPSTLLVLILLIAGWVTWSKIQDQRAANLGFADRSEMAAAERTGIAEPERYREYKKQQDEKDRIAAAAKAAEEAARIVPRPDVQLVSSNKGGFGNVALIKLKIINKSSETWVKDIAVACTFYGPSGTSIGTQRMTIYETIQPSRQFVTKQLNFGLIDQQATQVGCRVVTADVCCDKRLE